MLLDTDWRDAGTLTCIVGSLKSRLGSLFRCSAAYALCRRGRGSVCISVIGLISCTACDDGSSTQAPVSDARGESDVCAQCVDGVHVIRREGVLSYGRCQGGQSAGIWTLESDGEQVGIGQYKGGVENGIAGRFASDGLSSIYWMSGGRQQGWLVNFDTKGNLISCGVAVDNMFNGRVTVYYPSGELRASGDIRNGLRYGEWSFWMPDGNLDAKRTRRYEGEAPEDE